MVPAVADLIAVIGCGNRTRSDDGFGGAVIRRLAERSGPEAGPLGSMTRGRAGPRLVIRDAGTDGMAVMLAARGCSALIVVDACRTGGVPGTLFELPADAVAAPHRPSLTLHDFRWDHALHAGRAMWGAGFPSEVTVLLVEAASVAFGLELSPAVALAVDRAVARIEQLLAARGLAPGPAAVS